MVPECPIYSSIVSVLCCPEVVYISLWVSFAKILGKGVELGTDGVGLVSIFRVPLETLL